MKLSAAQLDLVRTTFARLQPKARVAALAFYQRLFAMDPSFRSLFHTEIEVQAEKLITMLKLAVEQAGKPEVLGPALATLGRRHVDYGVRSEHYATVGGALLWSLGTTLGDEFTPAAQEAWAAFYQEIAGAMLGGAAASHRDAARLSQRPGGSVSPSASASTSASI